MLYLINGPPQAGKDTVAHMISACLEWTGAAQLKFSKALKDMVHRAYDLTTREGTSLPHDFFERSKDGPCAGFLGLTPRQAYIDFHERYLIPVHGREILGVMLVKSFDWVLGAPRHAVLSDVGNEEQCWPLVAEWEALTGRTDQVTLIHLSRSGYQWTDNRIPVNLAGIRTIELENPGEGLLANVRSALELPSSSGDSLLS